jgi:glycosyltransferase involved in cell wall biosynthesis
MNRQSKITIGMPVFNGDLHLKEAIESLRNQTFRDWHLTISDNSSTDDTAEICEEYCKKDIRISCVRHTANMGSINNFAYLISEAESDYFMWAAHDDVWDKNFLGTAMQGLDNDHDAGLFFSNMVNIDENGKAFREYPSLSKYMQDDRHLSLLNYVLDPEKMGKANLWYGVIKLAGLKDYIMEFLKSPVAHNYASDVAMVLGLLCRTRVVIDERVLFFKRLARESHSLLDKVRGSQAPLITGNVPSRYFPEFRQAVAFACNGTDLEAFIMNLMGYRERLTYDLASLRIRSLRMLLKTTLWNVCTYGMWSIRRLQRRLPWLSRRKVQKDLDIPLQRERQS